MTLTVAVHVSVNTSLVEKAKLAEDKCAQRKQRMIDRFNIALACAMVAQTAWHCSPLLYQLHNEGRHSSFL